MSKRIPQMKEETQKLNIWKIDAEPLKIRLLNILIPVIKE